MNDVELKAITTIGGPEDIPKDGSNTDHHSNNDGFNDANGTGTSNPAFINDETEMRNRTNGGPKLEVKQNRVADGLDDEESSDDDDDDDDDVDVPNGAFVRYVAVIQNGCSIFYTIHNKKIWSVIYMVLLLLYFAYFGYSMYHRFDVKDEGTMRLLVVTILAVIFVIWRLAYSTVLKGKSMKISLFDESRDDKRMNRIRFSIHMLLAVAAVVTAIVVVVVEVALKRPRNLISLSGLAFFIISFYIFSHNPAKVNWRPVFWGVMIQFYFALIILRSTAGSQAFLWAGDRIKEFLEYTDEGSSFVFGPAPLSQHTFAFKVLPIIIFFSSCVSVLYHWGVMQFVIRTIARFLAWCLGTSPAESLNAAGNIFIGQSEAPLMIRPFLKVMTKSELHAICTGGFATIAGGVMATYISMKIPANHLLSASVMSAPAALAMSKLFYPETKRTKASAELVYNIAKGTEYNFIQAAANGASMAAKLVANIAVNLIAFIAILAFVNATLTWFGDRAGMTDPKLTFQLICSYVFWPIAYLMGTDMNDCMEVASMIGTKTFINEYVAYTELKVFVANRQDFTDYLLNTTGRYITGVVDYTSNGVYVKDLDKHLDLISDRSVVISTYALCGFSNLSSMGIMLGALGALAPNQKSNLARIVFRAMVAGNVACFMTAAIAGLLYEGP